VSLLAAAAFCCSPRQPTSLYIERHTCPATGLAGRAPAPVESSPASARWVVITRCSGTSSRTPPWATACLVTKHRPRPAMDTMFSCRPAVVWAIVCGGGGGHVCRRGVWPQVVQPLQGQAVGGDAPWALPCPWPAATAAASRPPGHVWRLAPRASLPTCAAMGFAWMHVHARARCWPTARPRCTPADAATATPSL